MRRYSKYKESGVVWIGEIPKHWIITRLKYVSNIPVTYGLNIEADRYTTEGIRLIRITDIDESGGLRQKGVYLPEDCVPQEQMLNSYDLLLSRSGATVGKSYLHLEEGKYTSAGYLVRFNFGDYCTSKFIYYVTLSHFYRNWLEQQIIISTIQNVNGEKYSNFQLPIPLHHEQTQIVNFLDRKTKQIDELTRIKERNIELLHEQRTVLINQAVTKGLDPNVEMKPSGVEWIGEIPAHWEVVRNKFIFRQIRDVGYPNLLLLSIGIKGIVPKSQTGQKDVSSADKSLYKRVKIGDIAFNVMTAWKGGIGMSDYEGIVSPAYQVCRPTTKLVPKYFHYLFRTDLYKTIFDRASYQVVDQRHNLYYDNFKNISGIFPSFSEQTQIVNFLDHKTKQIDELIAAEQRKVELLKEYRQSLISEAVTGKIDVRSEV